VRCVRSMNIVNIVQHYLRVKGRASRLAVDTIKQWMAKYLGGPMRRL